jgi:hypothetical protein
MLILLILPRLVTLTGISGINVESMSFFFFPWELQLLLKYNLCFILLLIDNKIYFVQMNLYYSVIITTCGIQRFLENYFHGHMHLAFPPFISHKYKISKKCKTTRRKNELVGFATGTTSQRNVRPLKQK